MGRIRKIGVVLYLIAAVVVVGLFAGSQFGPHTDRFDALLAVPLSLIHIFEAEDVVEGTAEEAAEEPSLDDQLFDKVQRAARLLRNRKFAMGLSLIHI